MSQNSILAKLLATENISVHHGNYETAWFDIKNRVLGLPQWQDKGKDVADLLIGHEVGHALETPFEGWHDSPEKLEGCPRSYINVIEDCRIERKIKSRYIGLVGPFSRGYKRLFQDGFFGSVDLDWDEVKLIDKINLKAKVAEHLPNIPFNVEEAELYRRSTLTNDFEDVLDLVRDILAYTKEHTPELITPPPPPPSDIPMPLPGEGDEEDNSPQPQSGHDDYEQPESEEQQTSESSAGEETDDRKENNTQSSKADDVDTPAEEELSDEAPTSHGEEDESQTDKDFRRKERDLLDFSEERRGQKFQKTVAREFSKDILKAVVVDYPRLKEGRNRAIEMDAKLNTEDYNNWHPYESYRDEFKVYYAGVKASVNYAVKEFEQKKAAWRWTRSETARTGSIDVNKLWAYKTDDDIFSRVTRLADAKNHGLVGLIDYSGSMSSCMGDVLDQVCHLAVFCKAVNIPFDFYGFTSENRNLIPEWRDEYDGEKAVKQLDGEIHHSQLSMPNILSSNMKKSELEDAIYHCYVRRAKSVDWYTNDERSICSKEEGYGSTPLNEALVATTQLIKKFQRKYNVDKMNLVVISDGDANGINTFKDYDNKLIKRTQEGFGSYDGGMKIHLDGRVIETTNRRRGCTTALLENLQKHYGVTTLGFFITDGAHGWRSKLQDLYDATATEDFHGYWSEAGDDFRKGMNKEYNKNKCCIVHDIHGYGTYYLLKGGYNTLNTEGEEFNPDIGSTKGQITSAFKKSAKTGKKNKVLLSNIGATVAQ